MQCCGDKNRELCPSFLSQAREISVKFEQVFKYMLLATYTMTVQTISMMARLIS